MAARPTKIPRWADDPEASIVEPPELKKDVGWEAAEKPPASYFNWLFFSIIEWVKWLADVTFLPGSGDARLGVRGVYSRSEEELRPGVLGMGPAFKPGVGVAGYGSQSSAGVYGEGGPPDAAGVFGAGGGTAGAGVEGFGASDPDLAAGGPGVKGTGAVFGPGVLAQGGANGDGVTATAGASGEGVVGPPAGVRGTGPFFGVIGTATGETGSGFGVVATGDNNKGGLRAEAKGTGVPVQIVGQAAAPTDGVQNGAIYYDTVTHKLRVRANGAWVDLH